MHEGIPQKPSRDLRPEEEARSDSSARPREEDGGSLDGSLPAGSIWRPPEAALSSPDSGERYTAARELGWAPSNDISKAYREGDDVVRGALVKTIGERGRVWDLEILNDAMRSGSPHVRYEAASAARALLRYSPEHDECGNLLSARNPGEPPFSAICCALGDALHAGHELVAREAALALAEIGPRAGRPYIEALTLSPPAARSAAFDAALELGLEGAASPFPQALEDGTKRQRSIVAEALGIIGREARSRARLLIGSIGDDLLEKLDDPRAIEVSPSAVSMSEIAKLHREMLGAVRTLARMTNDYSTEVRVKALDALSLLGPGARPARAQVGAALSDPRHKVREAAMRADEAMRA